MKRWFIHVRVDNLPVKNKNENKWKKVFRMCLTRAEASYNMALLEKNDKLQGECNIYRMVCIDIKPIAQNQLLLAF